MKKLIYLSLLLLVSSFVFGQSVEITPNKSSANSTAGENILIRSNNASIGISGRRFNGSLTVPTRPLLNENLFTLSGGGQWGTILNQHADQGSIRFMATENWTTLQNGTKISIWNTPNGFAEQQERMTINQDGKVGIGLAVPQSKLHLHEPTTSAIQAMQLTTDATGTTVSDGLGFTIFSSSDLIAPRAARIMNNENAQLFLGANNVNAMNITPTGNIGINSLLGGAPTARFQIFHDTENDETKPHINLITMDNTKNGMIKMTNLTASRYFGQYFNLNSGTAAGNFLSFDYNGNTPILDLSGNGNVKVSGFTTLGNDATAPRIKMVTLTHNTASGLGGTAFKAHNLNVAKIIDYKVLVEISAGTWIESGHTFNSGRQFDTELNGTNILILNHPSNSSNIFSKPVKVVFTYTE